MTNAPYFIVSLQEAITRAALRIDFAEFDGMNLSIRGDSWALNTMSPWRLTREGRIEVGSDDEECAGKLSKVVGLAVTAARTQSTGGLLDPAFTLSDGSVFEVFSAFSGETWTLSIGDRHIVGIGSA